MFNFSFGFSKEEQLIGAVEYMWAWSVFMSDKVVSPRNHNVATPFYLSRTPQTLATQNAIFIRASLYPYVYMFFLGQKSKPHIYKYMYAHDSTSKKGNKMSKKTLLNLIYCKTF